MKEKKPSAGSVDEKEKSRELTAAEKWRLEAFEERSRTMLAQGWRRVELTVGIVKANVFAMVLLLVLALAGGGLFLLLNRNAEGAFQRINPLLLLALMVVLIVVHELIHGISWAIFAEHHWQDIEFGFMKQYLTPYCTCCVPLEKGQYIFGALMPLILLGILPMAAGILTGSLPMLLLGIIMADGAAGDILIVWKILRYQSRAEHIVCMDHPTQAGCVLFEK